MPIPHPHRIPCRALFVHPSIAHCSICALLLAIASYSAAPHFFSSPALVKRHIFEYPKRSISLNLAISQQSLGCIRELCYLPMAGAVAAEAVDAAAAAEPAAAGVVTGDT